MFFNRRSLVATALVSLFTLNACALDLQPISDKDLSAFISSHSGHSRRDPGNGVFDPQNVTTFYWGTYAGDNMYLANFTLFNPNDDEFILPIESFAQQLKAIQCGSASTPSMVMEFSDKNTFKYAKGAWDWVNKKANNTFTLVTSPNQCYQGDDRSPYLVTDIKFDDAKLKASLTAQEKEWKDIAHTFHLKLGHEFVDPEHANQTHPKLMRMKRDTKTMDISHTLSQNLFHFAKDSGDTAGLDLSADAQITTAGQIIADLDVKTTLWIPTDVNINIHPQGVHGDFTLNLKADGTLGKALDWKLAEIDIPVEALKIGKLLEIGPFVTLGVHVGSTQLTGTANVVTGARANIDDSAKVTVDLRHPDQNAVSGWTPKFEPIPPTFSAEISGGVKAWAEIGIQLKADVFGKWGYQASVDAQLPYFEASFNAELNPAGVCGSQKTKGVTLGASVGIDVNLNAGEVNKAPTFQKDLYNTAWPLFSTCIGVGADDVKTNTPPAVTTEAPASATNVPTITTDSVITTPASETPVATDSPVITSAIPLSTGIPGTISAGTGYQTIGGNSTLLKMVRRKPTAMHVF
ncbi:hypothetical protein BCR34DRAFT_173578 [Clohesyomyces aquaticus]|uniref:Uncharacterized protein n=1 Tax=Clohesyomyces aquaticus TaxID=1231657 RepID=A0A1Y1YGA0_9PLEO|nr:hypothetical protein BCR34DRAFT_173578 [Clohesyomyces aquaticus]